MTDTWDDLIYLTFTERIDYLTALAERQSVAGDQEAAARTREAIEREIAVLRKPQPEGVRLEGWEI
jgi:hypothetical protein